MKTTHKAKDLNGNWVEGWYEYDPDALQVHALWVNSKKGFGNVKYPINPSTLCERVRGTDFFEGDEMISDLSGQVGYLFYNSEFHKWQVEFKSRDGEVKKIDLWLALQYQSSWKPTGKNIHDESK